MARLPPLPPPGTAVVAAYVLNEMPDAVREALEDLDKAAGLDHRELTARSIYCPGLPG